MTVPSGPWWWTDRAYQAQLRASEEKKQLAEQLELVKRQREQEYTAMGIGEQRIGDAERNKYLSHLENMFVQGYLAQDEYQQRADKALTAKTYGDLKGLITDLPGLPVKPSDLGLAPERKLWSPVTVGFAILAILGFAAFICALIV